MPTKVYHWKHGWIPLDATAAAEKHGAAFAAVSHLDLPRSSHIVATRDAGTGDFSVKDTQTGFKKILTAQQAASLHAGGEPITAVTFSAVEVGPRVPLKRVSKAPVPKAEAPKAFPKFPNLGSRAAANQHSALAGLGDEAVLNRNAGVSAYLNLGTSGIGHQQINSGLRGTGSLTPAVAEKVQQLDQAFKDSGTTLPANRVFRRGSQLPPGVTSYSPGQFVVEPGYTSTTMDPSVAEDFVGAPGYWTFDILVPRGTRVLVSPLEDEGEVVLPRNSKYRVVSVDPNTHLIQMELVTP